MSRESVPTDFICRASQPVLSNEGGGAVSLSLCPLCFSFMASSIQMELVDFLSKKIASSARVNIEEAKEGMRYLAMVLDPSSSSSTAKPPVIVVQWTKQDDRLLKRVYNECGDQIPSESALQLYRTKFPSLTSRTDASIQERIHSLIDAGDMMIPSILVKRKASAVAVPSYTKAELDRMDEIIAEEEGVPCESRLKEILEEDTVLGNRDYKVIWNKMKRTGVVTYRTGQYTQFETQAVMELVDQHGGSPASAGVVSDWIRDHPLLKDRDPRSVYEKVKRLPPPPPLVPLSAPASPLHLLADSAATVVHSQ